MHFQEITRGDDIAHSDGEARGIQAAAAQRLVGVSARAQQLDRLERSVDASAERRDDLWGELVGEQVQRLLERCLRIRIERLQSLQYGQRKSALEGADCCPVPAPAAEQLAHA